MIILQSHEIAVEENFIMKMLLDHELQQRRYRSHDVTYYHNMHELCAFQKAKVASQTRLSYLKKAGPQLCIHETRFIHDNVPTTTRHRRNKS